MPHFIPFAGAGKVNQSPWVRLLEQSLSDTDHVLVLIRLDGGNDGLNTVVPIDQYNKLTQARPHVLLPEDKLLRLDGLDNIALHPAMQGIRDLYNEGLVKIIQGVGYPDQDLSHFRSSDIWMTGSDADEILYTGWAGRYLENEYPNYPIDYPNAQMPDPLSIEIGPRLSLTFQGSGLGMGLSVFDPDSFYRLVDGIHSPAPATPAGDLLKHVRQVKQQSNAYGEVVKNAFNRGGNNATYPSNNNLAEQLAIVARLISGGLKTRIYMVSISGFDTHDNQVNANDHTLGAHANLLRNLSESITAFITDINYLGLSERVLGMTFSEFGRRITSNFSLGTDHGESAPMFVFGNAVEGGVLGDTPFIPAGATYEDNLDMQFDFRSMYATMLKDWFCLENSDLEYVMLDQYDTLPILNSSACMPTSTREQNQLAGKRLLHAYPNPTSDWVQFDIQAQGYTMLQVFDSRGKLVATPVSRRFTSAQPSQVRYDMRALPSGIYNVRLQTGGLVQTRQVVKL